MKTPRVIYALPIPPKLYVRLSRIAKRAEISNAEQIRRYVLVGVQDEERRVEMDRQFLKGMRKEHR